MTTRIIGPEVKYAIVKRLADSGIDEFMLREIIKQVGNPPTYPP